MMRTGSFITDSEQFASCKSHLERCCRIGASLPTQVFRECFTRFGFEEFDWAMSPEFWLEIQRLCGNFGDTSLLMAVLEPEPTSYYKKEFGYFNWAILPLSASPAGYADLLKQHPAESPADSVLANSEKVVWLAQSGKWAVWGERSLEVCVLACPQQLSECRWHDVDWALKTALPNAFLDGKVPPDFAESLRRNYGLSIGKP